MPSIIKLGQRTEKRTYRYPHIYTTDHQLGSLASRLMMLDKNFYILGGVLASAAHSKAYLAATIKAVVIFLGAFVATRETVNLLLGATSIASILLFAVAGLLVAVLTGLESAFKWETRSTELRMLATGCQTLRWELTPQIVQIEEIGFDRNILKTDINSDNEHNLKRNDESMVAGIEGIIKEMEMKLSQIQEKAASMGINVAYEIEKFENSIEIEEKVKVRVEQSA